MPSAKLDQGIWIVVPVFNEANHLCRVLTALSKNYQNLVIIDDGSTDESLCLARSFSPHVIALPHNSGQGQALRFGIQYALARKANVLVTFDSDGQHRVKDIAALVEPLLKGEADVSLGSRFLGKAPRIKLSKKMLLKGGVLFSRLFYGLKITDTHNGLRAFTREAAQSLVLTAAGRAHASEILAQIKKLKLRYREIPVTILYPHHRLGVVSEFLEGLKVLRWMCQYQLFAQYD